MSATDTPQRSDATPASVYPVIMCGGSGTRLWPASRPSRPKQFIALTGERSLFQDTVERVCGLADFAGLVVVTGERQRDWVEDQLAELGIEGAAILLEPEGRDSAPAVAAALHHIARRDPDAVAVVVASDHHIPDSDHFRRDFDRAVSAAREGRIVTIGIRPRSPSSAYGYIRPAEGGADVAPVAAFVEKPDEATARRYIEEGYLWNSGNFIAPVSAFLAELEQHAPDVSHATRDALPEGSHGALALHESFREVPKISVDYAVMEKTDRASVLSSDLPWSDLGAWDAVHSVSAHDDGGNTVSGDAVLSDVTNSLVRVADGRFAALSGVADVAVVVEDDVTFVTRLDRAQDVKGMVDGLRRDARPQIDAPSPLFDVARASERLNEWLRAAVLPLWYANGYDAATGLWVEALRRDGTPADERPRARVQGRQAWVFSQGPRIGWPGPWQTAVKRGIAAAAIYRLDDGLMRTLVERDGRPASDEVYLYDQTFQMLALADGREAVADAEKRALAMLDAIERRFRHDGPGFREAGSDPFQSNAHMHLFEAALAWVEAGGTSSRWRTVAEEVAALAAARFIDPDGGFLREFFDERWNPAPGERGDIVEPGHQFEWSWLLARWAGITGDDRWRGLAVALFDNGLRGVDPRRKVALDRMGAALTPDGRTLRAEGDRARLWPQTEWLKAALVLRDTEESAAKRKDYERQAGRAWQALDRYLAPKGRGLWFDKLRGDGTFEIEPSPASSLYHIMAAAVQLTASAKKDGESGS